MTQPALPRKPTLADLMVMIGAFAVALVLCRSFLADARWGLSEGWSWFWQHWVKIYSPVFFLYPFALSLTALGLVQSHFKLRENLKRPGVVACFLSSSAFLLTSLFAARRYLAEKITSDFQLEYVYWRIRMDCWSYFVIYSTLVGGLIVAMAWIGLRSSGNWKSERSWIDRAGRLIGTCWIFYSILNAIVLSCMMTGRLFWLSPFWTRYISSK